MLVWQFPLKNFTVIALNLSVLSLLHAHEMKQILESEITGNRPFFVLCVSLRHRAWRIICTQELAAVVKWQKKMVPFFLFQNSRFTLCLPSPHLIQIYFWMHLLAGFSLLACQTSWEVLVPVFFETCLEFLTFFRRLEAFPSLSCSLFCKYLLEIWQYSRKTFLNFSWIKKRVNAWIGEKGQMRVSVLEKLCLTAQREMKRVW